MAWFYGVGRSKKYHQIDPSRTDKTLCCKAAVPKGSVLAFKNSPTAAERCAKAR